MTKSDLIDLEMVKHHETERAVVVSDTGERSKAVWIPKALCEIEDRADGKTVTVTMSERTAHDRGLI